MKYLNTLNTNVSNFSLNKAATIMFSDVICCNLTDGRMTDKVEK